MSVSGRLGLARSSTLRLSLLYLVLLMASVGSLFGLFFWSTTASLERQIDATIDTQVAGLRDRYLANGLPGLTVLITNRSGRNAERRTRYLLVDANFRRLAGNLDEWPGPRERDAIRGGALREFATPPPSASSSDAHSFRARTFSIQDDFGLLVRSDFYLLVGRDVQDLADLQRQMLLTFGWGLAVTLGLGAVAGFWIGRRFARRIEEINTASREVMAGDLSVRVPETRRRDDLGELAAHFNRMLAQIETLMAGVRQVSDNIAHDLRTPLARLRNVLEAAHSAAGGESQATREQLELAIEEADGLLGTFSALLRIARIEAGERRSGFGPVELSSLLDDVVELYEPLAEERKQRIERSLAADTWVLGDRDLLFQAVANLVDNAVKYSPEGAVIALTLTQDAASSSPAARICVADGGPGIPEADRPRVLDRFYRVETSRSAPGNGLGLSLVAAVAKLHDAEFFLEDAEPGLCVSLQLALRSRAEVGS